MSPGCDHCWAERAAAQLFGVEWGASKARKVSREIVWQRLREVNSSVLRQLAAGKKPNRRRVLCCTSSDFCERRQDLLALQGRTITAMLEYAALHWLILTKLPSNLRPILSDLAVRRYEAAMQWIEAPPEHVWGGVSVENQQWADERIPHLLQLPVRHRFVVCEPLLGPITLQRWLEAIEWVIIGVETGRRRRPANIEWIADLVLECRQAKVPVFVHHIGTLTHTPLGLSLVAYREVPELLS